MVEVSIIVPVYNVEEHLGECLDSLCNQTFNDIEIICINAGSSDGSLGVLEGYGEIDSRISIYSQEKIGIPACRNQGLKKANGKYVFFMDGEDILEADAIEKLHALAEDMFLDLVIYKLINFNDQTGERFESDYYNMKFLAESFGGRAFNYWNIESDIVKIAANVQSKLYRRDLIKDMEFDEELIFEDNPFIIEAMFRAENVYFLDEFLYLRRVTDDYVELSSTECNVDVIPIANKIIDLTKEYGHYDNLKSTVVTKKIMRIMQRYDETYERHKQNFFERIKEDFNSRKKEYENALKGTSSLKETFQKTLECDSRKEFDMLRQIIFLNKKNKKLNARYNKLKKYNTARIQFKNLGNATNRIEVIKYSDENLTITAPKGLFDDKGQGMFVQSDANHLHLQIRAIGNGLLKIGFKSFNINMDNKEKFPIYIDYTKIRINKKDYITENALVCFDEPFVIEKRVKDSQIIDIYVEWESFTKDSKYINKYKALRKDYIVMEKDYNHIKRVNKMLYKQIGVMRSSTSWKVTKPIRVVGDFAKGKRN